MSERKLTKEQVNAWLEANELFCPACKSENLKRNNPEVDKSFEVGYGTLFTEWSCLDCGYRFHAMYARYAVASADEDGVPGDFLERSLLDNHSKNLLMVAAKMASVLEAGIEQIDKERAKKKTLSPYDLAGYRRICRSALDDYRKIIS